MALPSLVGLPGFARRLSPPQSTPRAVAREAGAGDVLLFILAVVPPAITPRAAAREAGGGWCVVVRPRPPSLLLVVVIVDPPMIHPTRSCL